MLVTYDHIRMKETLAIEESKKEKEESEKKNDDSEREKEEGPPYL